MEPEIRPDNSRLRSQTLAATRWQMVGRSTRFLSQLAITVLLARLLTPADFGVMGLCLLITGFAGMLGNLGLGAALVQRLEIRKEHLQAVLAVLLLLGVVGSLAIFGLGPALTRFLGIPQAALPLRVLSPILLIQAWGGVSRALLLRRLDFKRLFLIDFSSYSAAYGLLGVPGALLGWGVWSLVCGALVQAVLSALIATILARPPLIPRLSRQALRELGGFGLRMSAVRILSFTVGKLDQAIVSRTLGQVALGLYGRAIQLLRFPDDFFAMTLGNILFPAASRIQDDRVRMARAYRKATLTSSLLLFPAVVTLLTLCPQIILVLFGEQWGEAIRPAQVLLLSSGFTAQGRIASAFLRACGALRVLFICEAFLLALLAISCWPAARIWGLPGVAVAVSASGSLAYLLKATSTTRILPGEGMARSYISIIGCSLVTALLIEVTKGLLGLLTDSNTLLLIAGGSVAALSTLVVLRTPRLIGNENHQLWRSLIQGLAPRVG